MGNSDMLGKLTIPPPYQISTWCYLTSPATPG